MFGRPASARTLAAFALVGGVLQVLATVLLGLAPLEVLKAATIQGPAYYLAAAAALAFGALASWWLRARVVLAASVAVVCVGTTIGLLIGRATVVGVAMHGESILHHFLAVLSALLVVMIPSRWQKDKPLVRTTQVVAAIGAAGGLIGHLQMLPGTTASLPFVTEVGTLGLVLAWITGLIAAWRRAGWSRMVVVAAALLVPVLLRLVVPGIPGLAGATVAEWAQFPLMVVVFGAATVTFLLLRPDLETWLLMVVLVASALVTALFYLLYVRGFGELEDGLGGLAQSLFGFPLPYPSYVASWKVMAAMIAVFFVLTTVYGSLVSSRDRDRGIALGLMAVTGIGFTTPQLVLMGSAGYLVFLDLVLGPGSASPVQRRPTAPLDRIVGLAAERLGLPPPIVLEQARAQVLATRGDVNAVPVDIRVHDGGQRSAQIVIRIGVPGRDRAPVQLMPHGSGAGSRPPHSIALTHRVRGDVRDLEPLGDAPLDALARFPDVRARLWPTGCEIDLGLDLAPLDVDSLTALVRALARAYG